MQETIKNLFTESLSRNGITINKIEVSRNESSKAFDVIMSLQQGSLKIASSITIYEGIETPISLQVEQEVLGILTNFMNVFRDVYAEHFESMSEE